MITILTNLPLCKTCKIQFVKKKGRIYCSKRCAGSDRDTIENSNRKRKQTLIKKYGAPNPFTNKDVREKWKQTNIKKYGVEHPWESKEIQEKRKQTCFKKYGVQFSGQSQTVKNKKKQTNLQRYGDEIPSRLIRVKEKVKVNNMQKHGVAYPGQRHMMNVLPLLESYEWLYNEYMNNRKFATQIAERLNINVTTICNYLHAYGIVIRHTQKFSYKCIKWLESIEKNVCIYIQKEYKIGKTKYYADGYCKHNNTIYEFYGDVWHGNPDIFDAGDFCHPFNPNITAGELYQKVLNKENIIRDMGYNLVTIWEKQWDIQQANFR